MGSWKETSKAGFEFEDIVLADIIEKKYPLAYKNMIKEKLSYYDIILFDGNVSPSHKQKTVECKADDFAIISKNICLETTCNGRLSGILNTEADYWIIGVGNILYLITYDNIRKCLSENPNIPYRKNERVEQEKGVFKEISMYLVPIRIFEKYCIEVNDISEMTYNLM